MLLIDAALSDAYVLHPLQKLMNARSIRDLRRYEVVKDDRVPVILRELTSPNKIVSKERSK